MERGKKFVVFPRRSTIAVFLLTKDNVGKLKFVDNRSHNLRTFTEETTITKSVKLSFIP